SLLQLVLDHQIRQTLTVCMEVLWGAKEVEATRQNLAWPFEPFHVPEDVKSHWSRHVEKGAAVEAKWKAKFAEYENKYPVEAAEFKTLIPGKLPEGWEKALPVRIWGCFLLIMNIPVKFSRL
ncbi:hypothetical protein KI387_040825, partial [Taxus chinensis]